MASVQGFIPTQDYPITKAAITYLDDLDLYREEKPYHVSGELNDNDEPLRSNLHWKVYQGISFYDIRGHEKKLSLDENGFCFLDLHTKLPGSWENEVEVQRHLLNVIDLVRKELKADHVICYDRWVKLRRFYYLFVLR